jgi:protein-L-isoaspartate(D-aspartate) O-methyltransferase
MRKAMDESGERIRAAFAAVRRVDFLPEDQRAFAGADAPLPIGHGQTNSQPSTVARMLDLLAPEPGDRVLDVGCGSGWTTALLAHAVGPSGTVIGVELVPELTALARDNLSAHGREDVRVEQADPDVLGLPDQAPFDRILVSAAARRFPRPLVLQLDAGGRLVVPVRRSLCVADRQGREGLQVRRVGRYRFVPLVWNG